MKNVSLCVAVLFAAVMVAMASVSFAGPDTITYQGCVLKPDGSTVANGAYVMRFGIFDAAEAGHALWTESNSSVQVSGGVFSVTLGAMNPFGSLFSSHSDLWLEVSFDLNRRACPSNQLRVGVEV